MRSQRSSFQSCKKPLSVYSGLSQPHFLNFRPITSCDLSSKVKKHLSPLVLASTPYLATTLTFTVTACVYWVPISITIICSMMKSLCDFLSSTHHVRSSFCWKNICICLKLFMHLKHTSMNLRIHTRGVTPVNGCKVFDF